MKKWKLFMVCCLLVGSMGLFAACGTNDNNTNDTQNTVMDTNANDANVSFYAQYPNLLEDFSTFISVFIT